MFVRPGKYVALHYQYQTLDIFVYLIILCILLSPGAKKRTRQTQVQTLGILLFYCGKQQKKYNFIYSKSIKKISKHEWGYKSSPRWRHSRNRTLCKWHVLPQTQKWGFICLRDRKHLAVAKTEIKGECKNRDMQGSS